MGNEEWVGHGVFGLRTSPTARTIARDLRGAQVLRGIGQRRAGPGYPDFPAYVRQRGLRGHARKTRQRAARNLCRHLAQSV
jgi:hypothetical protein